MLYKTVCAHTSALVSIKTENSGFPCDQMVELMLAVQQEMKRMAFEAIFIILCRGELSIYVCQIACLRTWCHSASALVDNFASVCPGSWPGLLPGLCIPLLILPSFSNLCFFVSIPKELKIWKA